MNSWEKQDTIFGTVYKLYDGTEIETDDGFSIGENDLDLMNRLAGAGTDHSKYLRMIVVYADVVAPLYFWKEADTYRIGVEKNSCSTMHKIHEKEFTMDDFSHEHLGSSATEVLNKVIENLNVHRWNYNELKDKSFWWQMVQLLPSSYNQRRTVMLSYQALRNIYHARKNHKLDEWREFCRWIETLPYAEIITGEEKKYDD